MNRVLVTGAHGFTGSHLCRELLRAGALVRAFVKRGGQTSNIEDIRDDIELILGDVRDADSLRAATIGVQTVFHVATASSVTAAREDLATAMAVNVGGTMNVAESAIANGVERIVHVSTCHVYGNPPAALLPFSEEVKPVPNDAYSISRNAAEEKLRDLAQAGPDIVITRAFNIYGPNQGEHFLVPSIALPALRHQNPVLNDPRPTRDFTYVSDIVKGYVLAGEKGTSGEIYHFSSGEEISVGELATKILDVAKREFGVPPFIRPVWSGARHSDLVRSCGDSTKARDSLGWSPRVGWDEGIRETLRFSQERI